MSSLYPEIVSLDYVKPHPAADRLEIAIVRNTTVVVPKDQYRRGDVVVYFPPDLMLSETAIEALGVRAYLKSALYPGAAEKTACRVGAARLRGVPSFGFIAPLVDPAGEPLVDCRLGTDVSEAFGAVKYEPPLRIRAEDAEVHHPSFHQYTSLEHWYRFPDAIPAGELVRVTEKIHGTNSRVGVISVDGKPTFMAGSHKVRRKEPEGGVAAWGKSLYWSPLANPNVVQLMASLVAPPDGTYHQVIVFGELFGPTIQDMDYGVEPGCVDYRVFDVSVDGVYLDYPRLLEATTEHGVPLVPLIYQGPFDPDLVDEWTHGPTLVGSPRCAFKGREGCVITTLVDQFYAPTSRKALKSVSADYLARKGATDEQELAETLS